ncbi:unnamed protein product [Didymodactylos carnosus]|uniref:U-box domain-containing protein n=1 Tax=Didymodactylos carnosus TaxID=1234261 RepID=A0A813R3W9_9BILA|nr:unnamed protein product [Didymodactylos carnosus]CAF0774886.1 unnamed protein product [Didymodactylos carnosus]CAF3505815.1 unnamed protein product [Didymodactylos carnosus]CAF3557366.1 unnamed protein product [Didymodactylos carnosus]
MESDKLCIKLLHTLYGHSSDVNSCIFSPNLLASCSSDKTVRCWNLETLTENESISPLKKHTYQVHCVSFSPIERYNYLASVSTDGTCLLWDCKSGSVIKKIQHESQSPLRVCQFSSDGLLLATAGDDELINLWDIENDKSSSMKPVKTFTGHSATIVTLKFIFNNQYLISGSFYGDIKLWMVSTSYNAALHFEREAHDLGVTCLDTKYCSVVKTETVVVESVVKQDVKPTKQDKNKKHSAKKTEDNPIQQEQEQRYRTDEYELIASGGNDNKVKLWHATSTSLKYVRTLSQHSCAVMCVAYSPIDSSHLLASGSGDKTIIIWDYISGQILTQFEAHERYVTTCSFSFDGKLLVSGSNDRLVKLWTIIRDENQNPNQNSTSSYEHPLPIDEWTNDTVEQWLKEIGIKQHKELLNGKDLLNKSDMEIIDLFQIDSNSCEVFLKELNRVRHKYFIEQLRSTTAKINKTGLMNHTSDILPNEFICPITHELMLEPTCASDGYSYEKHAIEEWILQKKTSPITNLPLKYQLLYPNKILKMLIEKHFMQNNVNDKMEQKYGYVHLSAGDLLREECANKESKYGQLINDHIKGGQIVPVEITCKLLEQAMNKSDKQNFLVDGFPRNQDNVEGWNKVMDGKVNLQCVLFFDCSEDVCVNRCLDRGKNSGRVDDNAESIKKRIHTYNDSTRPVIQLYEKENLVKKVDASNDVEQKRFFSNVYNILKSIGKGTIVTIPIVTVFIDKVATVSLVDGVSMQPILNPVSETKADSDWIIIKRWNIDNYEVQNGDILSFESPRDPGTFMIKRVKFLEGEQVYNADNFEHNIVPKGQLWVEGDNKRQSYDSRHFGCVSRGLITGKALWVAWPPRRFGLSLNNAEENFNE